MIARSFPIRQPLVARRRGGWRCSRFGIGLAGCADMSDSMTSAFADPAKYEFYDCKQLETERKNLASRAAELQGLMARPTPALPVPWSRSSPIATIISRYAAQAKFAEEAWRRNKCHDTPPAATRAAAAPRRLRRIQRKRSHAGSATRVIERKPSQLRSRASHARQS